METLTVVDANVHNLKHVSVTIPRDKLVVFTGVSGSGKSSLAFDTIFAEGQRRYVESMNAYARQFMGEVEKPDVAAIEGLSPAIAIDQKSTGVSPRSTVGTVTEVYDFLRVLFARIGIAHDPDTGERLNAQTQQEIIDCITAMGEGSRLQLLSPVVRGRKGDYNALFKQLRKEGYTRIRIDGTFHQLEALPEDYRLSRMKTHEIEVVIDRIVLKPTDTVLRRLGEAVEKALKKSGGFVLVQTLKRAEASEDLDSSWNIASETLYSRQLASTQSTTTYDELSPRLFSFNSPYGACPACNGLGVRQEINPLRVFDPQRSLETGGIPLLKKLSGRYYSTFIQQLSERFDIPVDLPFGELSEIDQTLLLYGPEAANTLRQRQKSAAKKKATAIRLSKQGKGTPSDSLGEDTWDEESRYDFATAFDFASGFQGIIPVLNQMLAVDTEGSDGDTDGGENRITFKPQWQAILDTLPCSVCEGKRLKPFSLAVTLGGDPPQGKTIDQLCDLSIEALHQTMLQLPERLNERERRIGQQAISEVEKRLRFLLDVGLGYLTLARSAATLSGGESQRIRLASQIGSSLSGVLYVLDEPSIGLHPYNNRQLIQTLLNLRDLGNSLIVVEHDEDTLLASDWIVDLGPQAGRLGGELVVSGPTQALLQPSLAQKPSPSGNGKASKNGRTKAVPAEALPCDNDGIVGSAEHSLTLQYLRKEKSIAIPTKPRKGSGKSITLQGANKHNLKGIDVEFPLGKLIGITGLSGSGKSTLVFDLLYPALKYHLGHTPVRPDGFDAIEGLELLDKCIEIDQTPIGRTRRSNPATYTGLFDPIRQVFAQTEMAKLRGYGPGRFSFNVKGGRCEPCKGEGRRTLEMNFLPDATIECEVCHGKRFNRDTLDVTYREKTIADVLDMTVREGVLFFEEQGRIRHYLEVLQSVGLGYIHLGQPATTLSGGEAQRLKLATELVRKQTGNTLYLMDEPTIGLHWQDLEKLIDILQKLVDQGNTVIVIEHNLDLLKTCDWLIELGPESGDKGGYLVGAHTPRHMATHQVGYTGEYLAPFFQP